MKRLYRLELKLEADSIGEIVRQLAALEYRVLEKHANGQIPIDIVSGGYHSSYVLTVTLPEDGVDGDTYRAALEERRSGTEEAVR